MASVCMSSGVNYWEIIIDKFVDLDDIIIGVVGKGYHAKNQLFDCGKFYGWIATGGRKVYPSVPGGQIQGKEYGGCAKLGDTIGVIFEFKQGTGHLSFVKNGNPLGPCHTNIPPGSYYPVAHMLYGEVQITLNAKASLKKAFEQKPKVLEQPSAFQPPGLSIYQMCPSKHPLDKFSGKVRAYRGACP